MCGANTANAVAERQASLIARLANLPIFAHSADRWLIGAAIAIGLLQRLAVAFFNFTFPNAEAGAVARALAQGRGFADALFPGEGPTAHLMPIAPAIGGAAYKLFGTGHLGQGVLLGWSLLQTVLVFIVASYCIYLAGAAMRTAILAFVLLCVLPIHLFTEVVRWRVWDGGLGTLLALTSLAIVLRGERRVVANFCGWKAALPAFAFIVNPITGIMAGAVSFLSTLRHRRRDGLILPLLGMALCLTLVLTPWVARNHLVMGKPILTRDNFGLELAVGNFPEAVHPVDEGRVFMDHLAAIHPHDSLAARRELRAVGGEIAFSEQRGLAATHWMRDHRAEVAMIWRRHVAEMLFPRPWMFAAEHEGAASLRSIAAAVISVLALLGLAAAAWRRDWRYGYFALYIVIPVVIGMPFQPVARYCWVLYPVLACLAVDLLIRLANLHRTAPVGQEKLT